MCSKYPDARGSCWWDCVFHRFCRFLCWRHFLPSPFVTPLDTVPSIYLGGSEGGHQSSINLSSTSFGVLVSENCDCRILGQDNWLDFQVSGEWWYVEDRTSSRGWVLSSEHETVKSKWNCSHSWFPDMFLLPTLDLTALCKQKPSQSNGIVGAGNHLKDVESSGLETTSELWLGTF